MIKYLCLAAGLVLASTTAAQACSPVTPLAVTEPSYGERVKPYLAKTHRNMVDSADHIAIGTFKYSKRKQTHRLKISETIKRPMGENRRKRVAVTFNQIQEWGITYSRETALANRVDVLASRFIATPWSYGISGSSFDTSGSCGTNLELSPDAEYLIFANNDYEISSMFIVSEQTRAFQKAIKKMVQNPQDSFGVSFSLQETIERANEVKLLQTTSCSPTPTYKILRSSAPKGETTTFKAQPIMMFEDEDLNFLRNLSAGEIDQARSLGQKNGLYTNAPPLEACQTNQRFLMLGQFLSPRSRDRSGQMIVEKDGYFDLSETAFEYHMSPEKISFDQVVELLDNLKQ